MDNGIWSSFRSASIRSIAFVFDDTDRDVEPSVYDGSAIAVFISGCSAQLISLQQKFTSLMFDGNYRSGRRQVDLSGGSSSRRRKVAAPPGGGLRERALTGVSSSTIAVAAAASVENNRAALLDEARRLREERARHFERNRSATQVQRVYRGYRSRLLRCGLLEAELAMLSAAKASDDDGLTRSPLQKLEKHTTLLNVWLFLSRNPPSRRSDEHPELLLRMLRTYAACVRACKLSEATVARAVAVASSSSPPLAHRILQATFQSISLLSSPSARSAARLAPADARSIVSYAVPITLLVPGERLRQIGGTTGWVCLLEAIHALDGCCTEDQGDATCERSDSLQQLKLELWKMAVATSPQTVAGGAALAVTALSQDTEAGSGSLLLDDAPSPETLRTWFSNLVQVLSSQNSSVVSSSTTSGTTTLAPPPSSPSSSDPIVTAVIQLHTRRSITILRNAMRLFRSSGTSAKPSPASLLRYLHLLPDSLLAVASFLVQGGDDRLDWEAWRGGIASGGATASAAVGAAASASHLDDDEDEDESDPDEADRSRVRAAATTSGADARFKSSSASRLTKQDLQTLTKIDRSYHQAIRVWRTSVLEDLKRNRLTPGDAVLEQARQLCDPDEWLQWGKAVLLSRESTEDAMLAQEAYVAALAALLQSATGLKARDSVGSRFLGVLALDAAFVEHLWRYSMVQLANNTQLQSGKAAYLALSVFCDVFSHRLLAMRDDHFLRDYTTAHGRACVISAEHVIIKLRDMLYELFWTKPVRAEHVVPLGSSGGASGAADWASGTGAETRELHHEAVRGRLLLTGTKLWQSLYERWCRLVRQAPFCDEAAWWFPHVTTLSSEDAVVGRGGGGGRLLRSGVEDMDLDTSDDDDEADSESADPMSVDAVSEELAHAFSDPKMARVLTQIPQALPFERRVKLFHSLLATDKLKTQDEDADMRNAMLMAMRGEDGEWSSRERVSIRRDRLYEDSMRQLNRLGPKLRKKVQVSFINQYGQNEAGIDGGGVFKEFVDDLIKDAFSGENTTSRRLFSVTPLQTLAVNTRLPANASLLDHYEFLGRVLGKAVYESILVEPQFCLPFLNQLLGKTNSLEDLKNFDFEFYRNLTKLLVMPPEEVDGLGLTFELTLDDDSLRTHTVELVVGGRTTPVNKGNVIQYVHLVAHQRLNVESSSQTKAFLRGFRDLVPAAWVRLFSAYELQKLISGDDSIRGIDVGSLKRAMQYAAGYHPSQPIVHWFWEILEEMSAEQQRLFLRFMTSCSRQPLLGFASMEPAPCIQQIRLPEAFSASVNADKNAPLPTSSTCMNLLKLPNYWSKELMRRKLLAAIESGAGFELT